MSSLNLATIQKPDRVRIAVETDRARLLESMMMAHSENGLAPLNEGMVLAALENMIGRKSCVAGIIDGTTALAGSVGLTFAQFWYSNEWHVEELWCFVHPDYRAGKNNEGHARELLKFAVWWANQMGLPLLMGVLSHKRTQAKLRLYQRTLPMAGGLFLYRPGTEMAA